MVLESGGLTVSIGYTLQVYPFNGQVQADQCLCYRFKRKLLQRFSTLL